MRMSSLQDKRSSIHFGSKVSLITVNYNQVEYTMRLIKSIFSQDYKNLEVIVVDNASKENPENLIRTTFPEVLFIRSEENLGFAGGNNLGLGRSSGDFLFFINNDARITDGTIQKMVSLFKDTPRLGIVSPLICFDPEFNHGSEEIIQFAGATRVHPITARNRTIGRMEVNRGQFNFPYPSVYIHGAAMMISREVLDSVGPMHEDYFLYYEELDWCERIKKAGFEIYIEPRAKVYHAESVTTGKVSTLKTYYLNRNRILFIRRNYSTLSFFAFMLFLIFFTIPKNGIYWLFKGQWGQLNAFKKAIVWHFYNRLQ